ncbi:MAG: energy-coupling factor ABC transporter permease [Deltaproteobacteria bacterium]|nr:energy-coupling factor ABC transporter permease [Deltaproteobacteria bacterium]
MHIPDGFLEPEVWAPLTAVSASAIAYASKKVSKNLDERKVPLMGVIAAFVFAAQMVNFPIGGGTSGHLMGGVLIATIMGPFAALLMISTVLIIQALLFQDGGITALGANIFNMGIVGAGLGYLTFKGLNSVTGNLNFAVFTASWLSVVTAAGIAAAELSISGVIPLTVSLPAMTGVHAIIGIGEGAITIAALGLISGVSVDVFYGVQTVKVQRRPIPWILLAVSMSVALFIAPFASEFPDGLERVAESLGFLERGTPKVTSPLPDYQIPGLSGGISTSMAGVVGVLVTFGLAYMIIKMLRRRHR